MRCRLFVANVLRAGQAFGLDLSERIGPRRQEGREERVFFSGSLTARPKGVFPHARNRSANGNVARLTVAGKGKMGREELETRNQKLEIGKEKRWHEPDRSSQRVI